MLSLTFFQRSTERGGKDLAMDQADGLPREKLDLADVVQAGQLLDGRGHAPPGRYFRPFAAAAVPARR